MSKQTRLKIYVQVFLGIEFVLFVIALLMPITPSKTGARSRLAERFFENPGYKEEVVFYWIFGNIVFGILGFALLIWWRATYKKSSDEKSAT